ncbi:MAG: phage protease [Dehalococcoidia bacterium]
MHPRHDVTADRDDTSHVQVVERDGVAQLFAFAKLPHVSESAPQRWVHVAREGVWRGHQSGVEIALTHEVLAGFVARFAATKNATVGTYGHPPGDDFPASLWILDMELRGSDLWALCEFTPDAVQAIKGAKYRYCSIKFALESIDRESGKPAGPVIQQLGLTNIPFIDGLTPIALSTLSLVGASAPQTRSLSAMDPKKIYSMLASALGMAKDAPPDQLKTAVDAFLALYAATIGKPLAEVAAPADDTALSALCAAASATKSFSAKTRTIRFAEGDAMPGMEEALPADAKAAAKAMIADKLMEATSLDETALLAAVEQNLDAIVAVLTAGPSGTGLSAKDATIALSLVQKSNAALGARVVALSAKVTELEAGDVARAAKVKADAIEAEFVRLRDVTGHLVEAERAEFTTLAMSAGLDTATKLFSRGPAPGGAPLAVGPAAPKAKAPGIPSDAPLDEADPQVRIFRLSATGLGHKGADSDAFVRRALAMKATTLTA